MFRVSIEAACPDFIFNVNICWLTAGSLLYMQGKFMNLLGMTQHDVLRDRRTTNRHYRTEYYCSFPKVTDSAVLCMVILYMSNSVSHSDNL